MRTLNKFAFLSLLVTALVLSLFSGGGQMASAQGSIPDDELAYIDAGGFINIVDPVTPSGGTPFTWRSPTGGYTDMAALDVNGDGVDEIVAIAGGTVRLLVPFNTGGTPPQFSQTIPSGFQYVYVAAGDFVPGDGGRDEILVQRTDNRNNSTYSVQIYDGNADGASWQLVFDETFGVNWIRLVGGDVDGLEGDELIMIRNGTQQNRDKRLLIRKYAPNDPNGPWITLFNQVYNFPWIDLATGNTHLNNGDIDEIILTRSGVLGELNSFLVMQYYNYNLSDAPDGGGKYYPYWFDIGVGDINASGDDEVFLIRDPEVNGGVSLLGRNWGPDVMPEWKLSLGRDLQRIELGDVDGDGKAEIVLVQSSAYRIYWSPDVNFNHSGDQAVSLRQPVVIQLGNFDGAGISTEPPSMVVSPKSLGFEMTRGESAPPAQTFQVTNAGGGILNVHVDARTVNGGDWLEVTPFDATAPETFTVRLKDVVTSMEPGSYDANITVTGTSSSGEVQDGEQVVTVRLTIRPTGPMLEVAPERYDFSMNFGGVIPSADPITIRNVGDGGRLFYRITVTTSDGGNWLKLSKSSGFTDDTVDVTLEPRNLTPGDYTALITVTADDAVSGSPATIPVTLHIDATGMVVTPAELFINAYKGQPSPMAEVHIDQAVEGSGAITWYAYVVPAGDWWDDFAPAFAAGDLDFVKRTAQGLVFRDGAGAERVLQYVPWVRLTPDHGVTPRIMQVTLDVPNAPVGETRVTIIVDGGPGTPNRFQGVDTRIVVAAEHGALWLPVVLNQ
ncbi:MAG TPA: hypothetical protein EYP25_05100 [Anaerolineae bacterium]|nr:hypothetical protein [Anaerolineae bacterium]